MRISILDQSPIASGSTPAEALEQSIKLAQFADKAGFFRYWVAEHHGSESFAGCAPEILVGAIAQATSRIRVGSGGVMLMHYSPLKVAEVFKLLQTLHPGRIDCGIGRAPGSDAITAAALAYGSKIGLEYFPAKLADLAAFLREEPPHTPGFEAVVPAPKISEPPELWMLASTRDGAELAAHFGLPLACAHFINPDQAERLCERYRQRFRPSTWMPEPRVMLGVFALCAETHAEAERLARCRDLWRVRVHRGEFKPFPSVAEAEAEDFSEDEQAWIDSRRKHQLVGTGEDVRTQLDALTRSTGADELTVITITHDFDARLRSYELLAAAFALSEAVC